jgi:RNA polymerase primary sigma factor
LRERSATLGAYFDDVRGYSLLSAEEEQSLARELEQRTVRIWESVLSYAPAVPTALEAVRQQLGGGRRRGQALERAAERALRSRSRADRIALAQAASKTAARLIAPDRDRVLLGEVLTSVRQLAPAPRGYAAFRRRVRAAERAAAQTRGRFVNANLRLVISVARRYESRGVALSDLIQEGNLGLMKAVDRFDYRRGLRFSTYATWWIRHSVSRAVSDTARTVRLPVHLLDAAQRIARTRRELSKSLQRMPTNEEVASELGLTQEKVENVTSRASSQEVSLDELLGEDGDLPRVEVFRGPANDERSLLEVVAGKIEARKLGALLAGLSDIEADVLRKRFALEGDRAWTLREIGKVYGVSRERIRQIQEVALSRLRDAVAERGKARQ